MFWKVLFLLLSGGRRNRQLEFPLSILAAVGSDDRWCWRYACRSVLCTTSLYNILELRLSKSVRCSYITLQAPCPNFARYHFRVFTQSSHKGMPEILVCVEVVRSEFPIKFVVVVDLHVSRLHKYKRGRHNSLHYKIGDQGLQTMDSHQESDLSTSPSFFDLADHSVLLLLNCSVVRKTHVFWA